MSLESHEVYKRYADKEGEVAKFLDRSMKYGNSIHKKDLIWQQQRFLQTNMKNFSDRNTLVSNV